MRLMDSRKGDMAKGTKVEAWVQDLIEKGLRGVLGGLLCQSLLFPIAIVDRTPGSKGPFKKTHPLDGG